VTAPREVPRLETERLLLRGFATEDAEDVRRLAGAREIAEGTLTIPHPYPEGAAEEWISTHSARWEREEGLNLAIERKDDGVLVGAIGLGIEQEHSRAELGYWVGLPYWREGYATEAGGEVVRYAFEELELNRVYAFHFTRNPASGRVLQKIGMVHEGVRRAHTLKESEFLDNEAYGILRSERSHG
jgi:[ribosomal protein S5]-alanine N-acetyltransferase